MISKRTAALIAAPAAALLAVLAACGPSQNGGGNAQESRQQQQDTTSLESAQPLPHFNYSQERQALITAEEIAANGTQTTSFFFNMGVRDPIFVCPSIGLGVPDSASLSNPVQATWNTAGTSGVAGVGLGQMDPDGIYSPPSSSGTFVICVNPAGQEYLKRWEGFVDTVTAGATWNYKTHTERLVGAPTVKISTRK